MESGRFQVSLSSKPTTGMVSLQRRNTGATATATTLSGRLPAEKVSSSHGRNADLNCSHWLIGSSNSAATFNVGSLGCCLKTCLYLQTRIKRFTVHFSLCGFCGKTKTRQHMRGFVNTLGDWVYFFIDLRLKKCQHKGTCQHKRTWTV